MGVLSLVKYQRDLSGSDEYVVSGLDLIRTVGYELKLPLTQIANIASMLSDGDYEPAQLTKQYLYLENSAQRMIQIIDSVLFAGRIETNQQNLNLQPTNIASVVHRAMHELRQTANNYNKKINLKITSELLPAAVDPLAVHHCFYGLVDLLIRSSDSEDIEILVHHQENNVMISMRDNGQPISMTQIRTAFSRFGRAANPISKLPDSAGMAFYVTHSLSRAMQGGFDVRNSGSQRTFSIRLPLSKQLELV